MHQKVLANFDPPQPLTLVSDPDDLLADELLLAELTRRGFRLLAEEDPVALRYAYARTLADEPQTSLVVVTRGALNRLPYDLWQQGRHVELALHAFFPNLDYPTVKQLSPRQRLKLDQVRAADSAGAWPHQPLSPRQTQDFLLRAVFHADLDALTRPADLLLWLDRYHAAADPMSRSLAQPLLASLAARPVYAGWPLDQLLADADVFRVFMQEQWSQAVARTIGESSETYRTGQPDFTRDSALQDALPRLVREGVITPMQVVTDALIPAWATAGVAVDEAGVRLRQMGDALDHIRRQVQAGDLRWEEWQPVAERWARLLLWRHDPAFPFPPSLQEEYGQVQALVDARFGRWLADHYTPLATLRLPTPHHLFHVPGYLAHVRKPNQRVALLIMDGMALADWLLIREAWRARHPHWRFDEQLLLAQIPTITAISRQALVAGRRPADFGDSLTHNRHEARHWRQFWRAQGLADNASSLIPLPDRTDASDPASYPAEIESIHTQALCCISPVIDRMLHGATQGAGDLLASVRVWLHEGSPWLEGLIQTLLELDYAIFLTSDHGHVEAVGFGQPKEGVAVESRSKRARIYDNANFAHRVHAGYPDTTLWHDDGLLPPNRWALMPDGRQAFAPAGQRVVSHGGLTLEEVVTPLVRITREPFLYTA